MKKAYVAPTVEKVEFQYDKVVAASGATCTDQWINKGNGSCQTGNTLVKNLLD